jgi:DNA polymerase, archaea type
MMSLLSTMMMRFNQMLDKTYISGWDKVKAGDLCFGVKGEPNKFIRSEGDRVVLQKADGRYAVTDKANIKLVQHEHYGEFRWISPPSERVRSATAKGLSYHPRQSIAIGEWSKPVQEKQPDGSWANKKVNNGYGVKVAISDVLPVVWVDESLIDLEYLPPPTTPIDNLPQEIAGYETVSKVYIDIETTGLDPTIDRVTMLGIRDGSGNDWIFTSPNEAELLMRAMWWLDENQPSLMFLHNGYSFDVPFIITRCHFHNIDHPFMECDRSIWRQIKNNAHGALHRVFKKDDDSHEFGGKAIAYEAFSGQTIIIDTMIALGLWDTAKKLPNLRLKPSVIKLKLRADTRLELTNDEIQECWRSGDLATLETYLKFDLEDTELLANFLMPSIWYQQAYLPDVSIMNLVHKNTGFKIQEMYCYLCPERPQAAAQTSEEKNQLKDSKADYGGGLTGAITGIFQNVAKIDVASLYPSLMVRYRLGSRKDPDGKYISVLAQMLTDRLAYKARGKAGDTAAAGMAEAIKLLMNSGYGFLGNAGYTFNDMENAALVTAYGRVILRLMGETIKADGGLLISADTDGLYFSHRNPQRIFNLVSGVLPTGISIELEKSNLAMFSLSKKNYCLFSSDGEILERKGNSLISHQTPIENEFTETYPRIYINHGQAKADVYYHELFDNLLAGNIPVEKVATTAKILSNWQTKINNLGLSGSSIATYYYTRHDHHHLAHKFTNCRTYSELETLIENHPSVPYFGAYYAHKIEVLRNQMLGLSAPDEWWKKKPKQTKQLKLFATK